MFCGTIISDRWAECNKLNLGIYEHQVTIHYKNFIDPNDENVHTQTSLWSRVKSKS